MFYLECLLIVVLLVISYKIYIDILEKDEDESKPIKEKTAFVILLIGLYAALLLKDWSFIVYAVLVPVVITAGTMLYKGESFVRNLYFSAFFTVFILLTDGIVLVANECLEIVPETGKMILSFVLSVGVKALLVPLAWALKKRYSKGTNIFMSGKNWLLSSLIALVSMGIWICVMILQTTSYDIKYVIWLMMAYLIAINVLVFCFISDMTKKQSVFLQGQIEKFKLRSELQSFETVSQNILQQRKRTHDYKNHIHCMYYLLLGNKMEELRNYVDMARENMHQVEEAKYNTNHVIADVIINSKYQEATNKGIVMSVETSDLSALWIKDDDLVIILANLLNNAIEAAEQCNGMKNIQMCFKLQEKEILLEVKNTHCNRIRMKNGLPVTSKTEDAQEHGFGVQNIKEAVERYNGSLDITYTDTEFCVSIAMKKEETD